MDIAKDLRRLLVYYERGFIDEAVLGKKMLDMGDIPCEVIDAIQELPSGAIVELANFLCAYPRTSVGWSTLPERCSNYLTPNLSGREAADLGARQYRESRPQIEFLRREVRKRLEELGNDHHSLLQDWEA